MTAMARILIEETRFGGQPALHAAPADRIDAPLPTVLVHHGFTRSKELDSNLAFMFARAGFRVVMPEADGHGERFDGDAQGRLLRFWDILRGSIDELPALREDLLARGLVQHERLAIAGLSMGGFQALGALARYEWLRAGVSWMGSAYYLDLARTLYPPAGTYGPDTADRHETHMVRLCLHDPSTMLERLADRPLLLWHGMRDDVVPFSESARLHAQMVRRGLARQLEFIADPNATHKLPLAGAQAGVDFLRRVL